MMDKGFRIPRIIGEEGGSIHLYAGDQLRDEPSPDWPAVLRLSQAISSEIVLERLLDRLLKIVIEVAGAENAFLFLEQEGELYIRASARLDRDSIKVLQESSVMTDERHSIKAVDYVRRTWEYLALTDAARDSRFIDCTYIQKNHTKSLLCMPVLRNNVLIGILYLENKLTSHAFTPARVKTIHALASQTAISLENARLHSEVNHEAQVRRRAEEVLHTITQATAVVTGKDFFFSLLHNLALAFNVREAFITECTDQSNRQVRTIARLIDGKFQENYEYELSGTPCEGVMQGVVCYYPRNVERLYVKGKGKESFLGAPHVRQLWPSNGSPGNCG
jgi:GAF domain-containing protein